MTSMAFDREAEERDMSYERREALRSLATARDMLDARDPDPDLALYWAFIAGQEAAGKDYVAAKQEAAALDLVPPCLQTFPSVPVRPPGA